MHPSFRKALPHLAVFTFFLVLTAVIFRPQIQGKVPSPSDIVQYRGMSQEAREYFQKTGRRILWTNSMFGGMPTYQISEVRDGNLLQYVDKFFHLGFRAPIGLFFCALASFYILAIVLGLHPLLGVLGAIAFGLTTNNFILFETGHISKLESISYLPLVAAGMLLAFRMKYLAGGALFALGFGLTLYSNHVQMTYYFLLTIALFGIGMILETARTAKWRPFGKAVLALLVGGLLGLGSAASNLLLTYEYSKDTMRGDPILEVEGPSDPTNSSQTSGLAWDYAMQWSNGWIDLFSVMIPGVAGGGTQEVIDRNDSAIARDLQRKGYSPPANQPFRAPLYWGALPFTSGPPYFGISVLVLFLIGAIWVRGPVKWWLVSGVVLTLLLSLGKNLPFFNRFFFEHVPLYSKFRTPNSVLSITPLLIALLAVLGVAQFLRSPGERGSALRALYFSAGGLAAISLFFWLLGPSFFDFNALGDARLEQAGYSLDAVREDRQSLMRSDALRGLVYLVATMGMIWAYIRNKIKKHWLLVGLCALVLVDFWTVGSRYNSTDGYVSKSQLDQPFPLRAVDEQILQDEDPSYRVLDLTTSTFQSAQTSFYHKSIGGYHAAKLQRYQDIIDRHLSQGNQRVINMLNTRYFITGQPGQEQLQRNPQALGNAWFVDSLILVPTADREINALDQIDPAREVVINEPEFGVYVKGFEPQVDGSISLMEYIPDELTYRSNSSSEQFAVFSEIWYGPDKGWQAYIDGEPVPHIRVNYILRGIRIPAGEHEIVFSFEPRLYSIGVTLSYLASGLTLALLALSVFLTWREAPEPDPAPAKASSAKSVKRAPKKPKRRK